MVLVRFISCFVLARDGLEGRWHGKARRAATPWCNSVQFDSSIWSLKPSGSLCLTASNCGGTSIFHAGETFMDRLDIHQVWSGITLLRGKRCRRNVKMILCEKHLFSFFFLRECFGRIMWGFDAVTLPTSTASLQMHKFPRAFLHSESVTDVCFFPSQSVCLCGRSKSAIRLQEQRKSLSATCSKPPDFLVLFWNTKAYWGRTTSHRTSWRWSCSVFCKLKTVLQCFVQQRSYFSNSKHTK